EVVSTDLAATDFTGRKSRQTQRPLPKSFKARPKPETFFDARSLPPLPSAGRTRGIVAVVSGLVLAGFVAGAVLAVVWPLAIFLLSRRRVTLLLRNVLVGAGVFFVFSQGLEKAFPPFLLKANPPPPPMLQ